MIRLDDAKRLAHGPVTDRTDQVLLLLAVEGEGPVMIKEVKERAIAIGLKGSRNWNFSAIFARSGYAVRVPTGWELTEGGKERVRSLAGLEGRLITTVTNELRNHTQVITDPDIVSFLEEAISSLEMQNFRAAVVLSWVGAVALLQAYVVSHKLTEFNAEALRRDSKWKQAKTPDDIGRMKEHDFLQVLNAISVIGKNVKQELENCLSLRNACGHPNSLKVAESRVSAHIEILILNVYARFA